MRHGSRSCPTTPATCCCRPPAPPSGRRSARRPPSTGRPQPGRSSRPFFVRVTKLSPGSSAQAGGVPSREGVAPSVCAMAARAAGSSTSPASSGTTATHASSIVVPVEREGAVPDDLRPGTGCVPGAARTQQRRVQATPPRGDEQAVDRGGAARLQVVQRPVERGGSTRRPSRRSPRSTGRWTTCRRAAPPRSTACSSPRGGVACTRRCWVRAAPGTQPVTGRRSSGTAPSRSTGTTMDEAWVAEGAEPAGTSPVIERPTVTAPQDPPVAVVPDDAGDVLLPAARAAIAQTLGATTSLDGTPPAWALEPGESFVTLTKNGRLERPGWGCPVEG